METYYASPERSTPEDLSAEIETVRNSSVVSGILNSVSGLLAILNEHRQILALNDTFLKKLGIVSPEKSLGLRPGEALCCVHAEDTPAGCGTTKYCSTCGAAIAIVSALTEDLPAERMCALAARRDGKLVDMSLLVRSQPISINAQKFILLLVQDVTMEQRRAALARTFFHDINNLLGVVMMLGEHLAVKFPSEETSILAETSLRLHGEVAIQRYLSETETCEYRPMWQTCEAGSLIDHLKRFFVNHPVSKNRNIDFEPCPDGLIITTDASAFSRVMSNMIINALEATDEGGTVKVWVEPTGEHIDLCVWNKSVIPENISQRMFQRNFSTKKQQGRGIGTYSMKLLGEDVLGGEVSFVSSAEKGTVFRFSHPISVKSTDE